MTDVILCAASNLFRMYVISRFMKVLLGEPRVSRGTLLSVYGIFYAVNTALYLLLPLSWVNLLCNLAGLSFLAFFYTRSAKSICFAVVSYAVIGMACEYILMALFADYEGGKTLNQILQMVSVLLSLVFELLAERIIKKRNTGSMHHAVLLLVPLGSVAVNIFLIYADSVTDMGLIIINLGFLLMDFLVFYLYYVLSEALWERQENASLRRQLESYSDQMQLLEESSEKVKALRHDMKHHMNEIRLLAKQDKTREIQNYIDDMQEFAANPKEIAASGNQEADSILNYMLQQAKAELNSVAVDVQLPESLKFSFDLNVILGNLLENAIEGAKQSRKKQLSVNISFQKNTLRIEIENSSDGRTEIVQGRFLTTKADKELHGIGLNNVKKIVEKYRGIMEISAEKDTFRVKVLLYLSS